MNNFYNNYCPVRQKYNEDYEYEGEDYSLGLLFGDLERSILKKDNVNSIKQAIKLAKNGNGKLLYVFIEFFVVFKIGIKVPNMPFFVNEYYKLMSEKWTQKNSEMIIIICIINGLCNCKVMDIDLQNFVNFCPMDNFGGEKMLEKCLSYRKNYKECFGIATEIKKKYTVMEIVKKKIEKRNFRVQRKVYECLEIMWKRYKIDSFVDYTAMFCCYNQVVDNDPIWNPSDFEKGFKLSQKTKDILQK